MFETQWYRLRCIEYEFPMIAAASFRSVFEVIRPSFLERATGPISVVPIFLHSWLDKN